VGGITPISGDTSIHRSACVFPQIGHFDLYKKRDIRTACKALTSAHSLLCDNWFFRSKRKLGENGLWEARLARRPRLDSGISSEQLAYCGRGICHGFQSTFKSAKTEFWTLRDWTTFSLRTSLYVYDVQLVEVKLYIGRAVNDVMGSNPIQSLFQVIFPVCFGCIRIFHSFKRKFVQCFAHFTVLKNVNSDDH